MLNSNNEIAYMHAIRKYTRHQFKSLIQHLKEYKKSRDSESLHHIRVNVKKIKALIGLIHAVNHSFKRHQNFIFFRNIFRKAGKIRDPQVLTNLLAQYTSNNQPLIDAKFSSQIEVSCLLKDIPKYIEKVHSKMSLFDSFAKTIKNRDTRNYLRKRKAKIKDGLFPKVIFPEIHKTRKQIKEVSYLSESLRKCRGRAIQFYDQIEKRIGDLHDLEELANMLKSNNTILYSKLAKIILSDCSRLKKQIKIETQEFYRSSEDY